MRDLDLLVRPEDAGRTVEALVVPRLCGCRKTGPDRPPPSRDVAAGEPSAVEIHTEALSRTARKSCPPPTYGGCNAVFNPTPRYFCCRSEWHFLHGLLHHEISDRGHFRKVLAVKPLWEFAMLAGEVARLARHQPPMAAAGKAGVLGSWIVQARKLYGRACRGRRGFTCGAGACGCDHRQRRAPTGSGRRALRSTGFASVFPRDSTWRYHIHPNDVSVATMFDTRVRAHRTCDRTPDRQAGRTGLCRAGRVRPLRVRPQAGP